MRACLVCGEVIDHSELLEQFEALFERVDTYGIESLTEKEQVVYEEMVCSKTCYQQLI